MAETNKVEKPKKMEERLYTLLQGLFGDDEEDFPLVLAKLEEHRLRKIDVLKKESVDEMVALGIPRGLARQIHDALQVYEHHTNPASGESGVATAIQSLAGVIAKQHEQKLEEMTPVQLLDRLVASADEEIIDFVADHPKFVEYGLVLKAGGKEIDLEQTKVYWRQGHRYLGQRWAGQKVVAVRAAFDAFDEYDPTNLNQPLQNGVSPISRVDYKKLDRNTRNFLAWASESRAWSHLFSDKGHGFVAAIQEHKLEGLKELSKSPKLERLYGICYIEYLEACEENPTISTQYIARLYRASSGRGVPAPGPF